MKKILMTRLSVCSLGVSCNEMIDNPMLLVVLVLCKTILHKGSNLSFRKIGAVIQYGPKTVEKVIILTIFFCTNNSGFKSLSPA